MGALKQRVSDRTPFPSLDKHKVENITGSLDNLGDNLNCLHIRASELNSYSGLLLLCPNGILCLWLVGRLAFHLSAPRYGACFEITY